MTAIAQYEKMRVAVQTCATIDEAAELRDKAAALAAYARQRDDRELEVCVSEIQKRACIRIGELSRELETAEREGARGNYRLPSSGKSKAQALAEAGISTSTAQRYEELVGGREQQGIATAMAAAEVHFAHARLEQKPATMEGLRGAIHEALVQTLGEPPAKPARFRPPPSQLDDACVLFFSAIRTITESAFTMEEMASCVQPILRAGQVKRCRTAVERIKVFINKLQEMVNAA
jgi:hypothetical protein